MHADLSFLFFGAVTNLAPEVILRAALIRRNPRIQFSSMMFHGGMWETRGSRRINAGPKRNAAADQASFRHFRCICHGRVAHADPELSDGRGRKPSEVIVRVDERHGVVG